MKHPRSVHMGRTQPTDYGRQAMDITLASATDQAGAIRSGDISAVELLDATLARYERFNPTLNAVIFTQLDLARERAVAADTATANGESWGPLHGVPMTIKEAWDWIGSPSTSGHESRKDWRPEQNSIPIQRLLDAGAVIYGKTNLPVSMADWQTFNPVYGTTSNTWNPDNVEGGLTPGGSSGGAAAALASGMTALELGSDIGASIRNPAHYCGIFGHKPTYGLVPVEGHGNPGSIVPLDIGVGGPMARYAEDLTLGLDIVAGPGVLDSVAWNLELPPPRKTRPDTLKAAVMFESPVLQTDSALIDQLAATVDKLGELGVQLDFEARPEIDIERSHETYLMLLRSTTGSEATPEVFAAQHPDSERFDNGDRDYQAVASKAITMSYWEWSSWNAEREASRLAWHRFFEEYDVLLCPTAASTAYPHDHAKTRPERTITVNGNEEPTTDQLFWAGWSCGVYLPGTVAPAGLTADGLPCGLQIVAGHLRDRESIAFAAMMETEIGGFQPAPGYEA